MGKKQTWKWEHLFLYFACLMVFSLGTQGCSRFKLWQGKQRLTGATKLMIKGKHQKSLEYNKEVLRLFPQMFGDQALFQMGLNYSHPENPNSSYQKAIESFQSIIVEYPESSLKDDAVVWVLLLRKIEEKEKMISELENQNESIKYINMMLEDKKMKLENQNAILMNKNVSLKAKNIKLEDQIKKLKEVDLGIEDKKRKESPEELGEKVQ